MTPDMIMDLILENALEIVLAVISLLVTCSLLPLIKSDLVPFLKEKRIYSTVRKFVQAAEKLAETGTIPKIEKSKYVIGLLEKNGITVDDTIKAFIESCCKEIDMIADFTMNEILEEETLPETDESSE